MPDNLATVLTINEVARYWGRTYKTVKLAIAVERSVRARKPPLVARQSADGIWLIDMNSVIARWGEMNPQEKG